jgi:hypothetical protein
LSAVNAAILAFVSSMLGLVPPDEEDDEDDDAVVKD